MNTNSTVYQYKLTRMDSDASFERRLIRNGRDAATYARQFYHEDLVVYESCFVIALDRRSMTIGWMKLSQGGLGSTTIPKEFIYKFAVDILASSLILVHNHPSGNPKPGSMDILETSKLRQGLETLGLTLSDHIILSEDSFYSFVEESVEKF